MSVFATTAGDPFRVPGAQPSGSHPGSNTVRAPPARASANNLPASSRSRTWQIRRSDQRRRPSPQKFGPMALHRGAVEVLQATQVGQERRARRRGERRRIVIRRAPARSCLDPFEPDTRLTELRRMRAPAASSPTLPISPVLTPSRGRRQLPRLAPWPADSLETTAAYDLLGPHTASLRPREESHQ